MNIEFNIDKPLFEIADPNGGRSTPYTVRESFQNCIVFGSTGSGKTSGSGKSYAKRFLENNYGGLILVSKPTEKKDWIDYCTKTGRLDDLVIIEPGGKEHFNFINYEVENSAGRSDVTDNLMEVFKTVLAANEERSGRQDDIFWSDALDSLMYHTIDLCMLAYGKVTVDGLYEIVMSAPKHSSESKNIPKSKTQNTASKYDEDVGLNDEDENEGKAEPPSKFTLAFEAAQQNVRQQYDAWMDSMAPERLQKLVDDDTVQEAALEELPDFRLLRFIDQYFMDTLYNLSEKTRSIVIIIFSNFLFRLLREPVYSLFCRGGSTVTPEDCLNGKVVLINLPVKTYHKLGQQVQTLVKYIFQRAMERRDIEQNGRPVFLYADEAQEFLTPRDTDFLATSRGFRVAVFYLTQNLPNLYANMGGEKSQYKVKAFLGNLSTKIFHANTDAETNDYASQLFGEVFKEDHSRQISMMGKPSVSKSTGIKLEKIVRPEEFLKLAMGGPANDLRVEGYLHRPGQPFANGQNFQLIKFKQ